MAEINISLGSVNEKLLNKDQITEEINGVIEQHQDDIKLITSELESLKKSMSIADTNHLESVEKIKMLTRNQQMLRKLLSLETNFNGKVVGVSNKAEDLKWMISNVDSETKNNSQGLISIQESLNI